MRSKISVLLAALTLGAGGAVAADDTAAGKGHYATCVACHGSQGEGNQAMNAPRLNHLEPVYLAAQLQKFKSGQRGSAGSSPTAMQMAGMAATLADDQAVTDVSAYIASLDSEAPAATVEGDVTLGGDFYNQFCGACHGPAAEGNTALNSPRLTGTDDWYLLSQLQAFRSGQRGAHPDDRTGRQMAAMAAVLPDEQALKNVVAFIRSLEQ